MRVAARRRRSRYLPYALVRPPTHVPAQGWWSMAALAVVCTALAFVLFFALIASIGPARATVITYVNPAVAVLCGVAVPGRAASRSASSSASR